MGYDIRDYVPEDLKRFFDIVGEDGYKEIVRIYGGTLIYIPRACSFEIPLRNEEIYKDYIEGISYRELVEKWNLSITALKNVIHVKKKERMALRMRDKDGGRTMSEAEGRGSDVRSGDEEVGGEDDEEDERAGDEDYDE